MLAHLAAETPEPAAPEAGLQDPGGCQAACPACSGVTEASVTVCLLMGGASEEHAAALALQHDPALGPQGEVLLGKASGRSRELSAVTGPN